ncbi:MAG: hypothetical protein DA405_00760 [Bacteroidetes bacterium]|nr:MAG: hypothetical protein DA405_00760 [Bacteroidota bacterium]
MLENLAALQASYQEKGFVVVRQFYTRGEMSQLRASMLQYCKLYPDYCVPEMSAGKEGKLLFQALDFAERIGFMKSFLESQKLQVHLESLLKEPAHLFIEDFHFKEPGGGAYDPHQDMQSPVIQWVNERYAPSVPIDKLVTMCLAVDEHTIENGCMQVAAGIHKQGGLGPEGGVLEKEIVDSLNFEPIELAAGDALFFDGYCPHGSAVNTSSSSRKALFLFFNPKRCGYQRKMAQDYFLHDKFKLK